MEIQQAYNVLWELIGRLPMTRDDRNITEGSLRLLYQKAQDDVEAEQELKDGGTN